MRRKCVISLRTQTVNLGDYLILLSSIDYLLSRYKVVVLDIKGVPKEFVESFKVAYSQEINQKRIMLAAISVFHYLYKRFDFFRKPGAYVVNKSFKARAKCYIYASVNLLRRFLNLGKAFYLPISITGNLTLPERVFLGSFNHLFVRDPKALSVLKESRLENSSLLADMCHIYHLEHPDSERNVLVDNLNVVVSFRFDRHPKVECLLEIDNLEGYQISSVITQVLYDKEVNALIAEKIGVPHEIITIDHAGLCDAIAIYAKADMVVSNRLHVLLLGAMAGATPVPLLFEDDHKVKDYFEYLGCKCLLVGQPITKTLIDSICEFNDSRFTENLMKTKILNNLDNFFLR